MSLCKKSYEWILSSKTDDFFDTGDPYLTLEKWISSFCKGSNEQKAFMLRMGMLGKHPMTLEQIGTELGGITREGVRQICHKVESKARYHLHIQKLHPLINKALEIVNSKGGRITSEDLVTHLLAYGTKGEMLRFAYPFIEFLSSSDDWKSIGLDIANGVIYTDSSEKLVQKLSRSIFEIVAQNADEILDDNLWSIDFSLLKRFINNWNNLNNMDENIDEISDIIITDALLRCKTRMKIEGNKVYSYELWAFRYGSIIKAAEAVLQNSKKSMHFTEVYKEIKKYRNIDDDSFTERNIHAAIARNEDMLLWDRGTFIHKTCVSIPHDLVSEIERWILQKLREDIPFISVYGIFTIFQQKCIEANIPTDEALYSILREVSHPLIAYPKLPCIYLKKNLIHRIPLALTVEQFIQDAEKEVLLNELKTFIIDKLLLKDFQFNQIIAQIPNTIRTEQGFLHTDLLNIDAKIIKELVNHIRNIISREEHVSITKIFKDKKISCKIIGIDDPKSLFSLLKLKHDDEFDFQNYPQIRILSKDNESKAKGVINELIKFIKDKNSYCSYQELQEEFVDKLGYNDNTVRYTTYTENICKYSRDSVIHKDTINWNNEKQARIEIIAFSRFNDCVKGGKCYGLIKEMIESDILPTIGKELYWSHYLLADLLISHGRFAILGSEKNAFVPIPNQFGIENFEDLVYEILKKEHDGAENLNSFANKLRESGIIRKTISPTMLGESRKVEIIRNEILLKGLLS